MKNYILILFFLLLNFGCSNGNQPVFEKLKLNSKYIGERNITVMLPPSYANSNQSYSVIYMHDGQMLFDSTNTWNGKEWGVDETLLDLWKKGIIEEVIVIGIDNGGSSLRHPEYFPQRPFEQLSTLKQDSIYQLIRYGNSLIFPEKIKSDNYLNFLVEELKPSIDSLFNTKKEMESTFIIGSSMGGLISMYAICEYPKVFGGAACLSTHWPGIFTNKNNPIPKEFFNYLRENIPNPVNHKLYFDLGTETLDSMYQDLQPIADTILMSAGYGTGNFLTLKFIGHAHEESAWNDRLSEPLTFLLKK